MSALLEAKQVSKHFGGLKAVDSVDMTINKGDIFGIIGPNGAGKTTFFNMCSGIYPITSGEIWLDGENITNMHSEVIARKGMARTFQNIQLFKYMSVLENVKIGFHINTKTRLWDSILHSSTYKKDEKLAEEKGLEILERVGLTEFKDTMAGNLSYGVQRRVEIARALALNPKILLIDEPAAGMNNDETKDLINFLSKLHKDTGITIVLIEHHLDVVMELCKNIMVLNLGSTLAYGNPKEILYILTFPIFPSEMIFLIEVS